MESTRKIGQDRYFLKILTFWSIFVQKSTFGNWTFTQFLSFEWRNGSQNRNVLEKLSGTGPFWKFWHFGQGQGSTWSKHFFSLTLFFFFFFRRFGPDQVSRSVWVKPGRSGQTGQPVVEDDVIHDVIPLEARVARALAPTVWRVCTREIWWRCVGGHVSELDASSAWRVCVGAWRRVKRRWWLLTFWWRVEARGYASWPEIFRSCRSKAAEDPCRVSFVKFWTGSHKFEGLCRGVSKDFGGAWQRVRPFLGLKFSGFVDRGPMDRVVASVL